MSKPKIEVLYTDIGGVLGTNGWDTGVRQSMCAHFNLDDTEIQGRHRLMFDSYERGFLTFEQYLQQVFMNSPRDFTVDDLRAFAYQHSQPWPENIAFFRRVKELNHLKMGLISNEGEGITQYRVRAFGLRDFADFMVISHFVHTRKPDPEIWHLALNLAQVAPHQAIYVDDREMFSSFAGQLGFHAIRHISVDQTREAIRAIGLLVD